MSLALSRVLDLDMVLSGIHGDSYTFHAFAWINYSAVNFQTLTGIGRVSSIQRQDTVEGACIVHTTTTLKLVISRTE